MNIIKALKNDFFLMLFYALISALSYYFYQTYPYIQTQKDLSGLFLIMVILGLGVIYCICYIVSMVKMQATTQMGIAKSLFAVFYWGVSSYIYVLLNTVSFLQPHFFLLIWLYAILLWIALYFSVFRNAQLHWKDYGLMFLIIFSIFMMVWGIPALLSLI